ncbi:hypothetical protein [Haloferula sp. A504]|uniref:hypothetical protein n=1 Tax=Haloferula sp. A504 TaxID=3373601 RepID=UPI0031C2D0F3|nr:hypothetical protein [Verrucomicrobiaceae bacterium E54]
MVLKRQAAILGFLLLFPSCDRSNPIPSRVEASTEAQQRIQTPPPPIPESTRQLAEPEAPEIPFEIVGEVIGLIDPDRLDGLQGKRAANRSLRRVCFVLESARREGHDPASVIDETHDALEMAGTPRAKAVKASP